jgi:RHS repeat-associated protein
MGRQLYVRSGSSVYYEITNPHGDIVALASSNALVGTIHFDAWGVPLTAGGTYIPFAFQGSAGSWTGTYGLVSMGARWYYPNIGRFLSSDPVAGTAEPRTPMAGLRWVYALDNPVRNADPSGLKVMLDDGGGCDQACSNAAPSPTAVTPPPPPSSSTSPTSWQRINNAWNAATQFLNIRPDATPLSNAWNAASQVVNIRPDAGGAQDNLIALGNRMDSGWKQRYRDALAESANWVDGTRADLTSGDALRVARGTAGVVIFASNFVPVSGGLSLVRNAGRVGLQELVQRSPQVENTVKTLAESCAINSFAAGTLVLMADGTRKPIEQVRVGDLVEAGDPQRGFLRAERVEGVIVGHGLKHMVKLFVDGEVIETTYNHPFWVVDDQNFEWAEDLKPGQHLLLADGRAPPIQAIQKYDIVATVYNLSVSRVHTFFVGSSGILVHNACIGGAGPVRVGQAGEAAVRSAYDIGEKFTTVVNGRTRIFDGLTEEAVSEVKNVARQQLTRQLRDYIDYARSNGLRFAIYVRQNTELSGPLLQADLDVLNPVNIIRYIP